MKIDDGLKLLQIERKVMAFKNLQEAAKTSKGWVKLIRRTLGMSLETLAHKLDVDISSLSRLEAREAQKKITLEKLEKVAQALGCELVYALVPQTTLQNIIESQAETKAKELLSRADIHMELEDQKVQISYEERLDFLKKQLIKSGDIW